MTTRVSVFIQKWRYYSKRYGIISACLRYLGRRCPRVWPFIGGIATTTFLRRWATGPGIKVLNLGGGGNVRQEWLTADVTPRADVFVDCCKVLPFANCSVDQVMLEEVIEHVDYPQGLHLLRECHRILRSDGLLRVSTPDFSWFAKLQSMSSLEAEEQENRDFVLREGCRFLRSQDAPNELLRAATLNQIFLSHGHRFIYTSQSLEELFRMAGFQFRRSTYRDINSKLASLDSHADRFGHPPEISLYYDVWKNDQPGRVQ